MISGAGKFWVWVAGGSAVAVAILLTGAFLSQSESSRAASPKPVAASAPTARPSGPLAPPRPLEVGNPRAPLVIDVYEDFLCPACAGFEQRYSNQIEAAREQGALLVRYHLLAVFDGRSASGSYSSRAAGAAICVREEDSEAFARLHSALFRSEVRPEEGATADLSNDQLAQIAAESGASAQAVGCVRRGERVEQAKAAARAGLRELSTIVTGQLGTPTVVKDRQVVDFADKEWLTKLLGG